MADTSKLDNIERTISARFGEGIEEVPYEQDEDLDEGEELEDQDESEEEELEEDADEPVAPKRKTSKEQAAIIALKRENKRLADDIRKLSAQKAEESAKQRKENIKAKYLADGYEEDVAEDNAEKEARLIRQEERLAIMEFREEHFDVLAQYPEAKADIAEIMEIANRPHSRITVEQICKAMYGDPKGYSERARAAATGRLPRREDDDAVGRAAMGSSRVKQTTLDTTDIEKKRRLQDEVLGGKKITNKRYLELKEKYQL